MLAAASVDPVYFIVPRHNTRHVRIFNDHLKVTQVQLVHRLWRHLAVDMKTKPLELVAREMLYARRHARYRLGAQHPFGAERGREEWVFSKCFKVPSPRRCSRQRRCVDLDLTAVSDSRIAPSKKMGPPHEKKLAI